MRTMAVIGTGLIGTSVALAACGRGVTVYLSDRTEAAARTAEALGAGVAATPAQPVDLAVIAVPPSQVCAVLIEAQERGLARCYTDVASVKAAPERAALSRAPAPDRYIGGHPLAGRERSGPLAARAELFLDRNWVLTPSALTSDETFDRALELVELCGAVPVVMRSQEHDAAVAVTSHVPHLMASLIAARLREGPPALSLVAGQGLRDATRIAGGDSRLWGDILRSNAPAVAGVLKDLHTDLSRLVPALDALAEPGGGDGDHGMRTLVDLLDRGISGLAGIPGTGRAASAGGHRVRVGVPDRPGELARLLAAVTELGVVAEDAAVDAGVDTGADGGSGLAARFTVPPPVAERMVAELRADGWEAVREHGAARLPSLRE
ncbi:prephenate dehydrogenase [Streptomyces kanamyceticus]|uniref:Prephenate dehydrogenase/arogenate dehydrogenase family protein n=1 Tax=Streptomyces kanamyceticus TaxID=1967 RepID=A0A5J6G368_STRKN|nr:prephenate dehydrogenase [Streptomyces kanamyceticus]QEU90010.1 prephenate dehydrogenase/arogenate dehydrogenase family protein [Streptomyces kanamyceticus]